MESFNAKSLDGFLFDHLLDGVAYCRMIFDDQHQPVDFLYVKVSKNFAALTGIASAEGKKVSEVVPGIYQSNPELFHTYGRVSLTGQPERFESYVEPLKRWFLVSVYCPEPSYFVAVFQNVTEQKQSIVFLENAKVAAANVLEDLKAERQRLAEANAKDEALLKSIPDGVVAVDLNGNVTHANAAAETLLQWKESEILGRPVFDVMRLQDEDGVIPMPRRPMGIALATGRPFTTTLEDAPRLFRRDGTAFPAFISAAPVVAGGVVGGVQVFHDITREKELDVAKSEFISIASHQLRTPLSTISWYTEALLAGHLGPVTGAQRKYTEEISKMNARMTELVNALLSVSRIELKTFKVSLSSVVLTDVADDVLRELAKPIADLNIRVVKDYERGTKPIVADASVAHMVLQNLLSNAVRYNRKDGMITVRIHVDGEAHVVVSDTGYGIPKLAQPSVFQKFFRADNAREIEPGGTGIGLYIVRSLLRHFGGSVWFESEENKGSTFHALMPANPPPLPFHPHNPLASPL